MARAAFPTLAVRLLVLATVVDVGTTTVPAPSVRVEFGSPFLLTCHEGSVPDVIWERRSYSNANWQPVSPEGAWVTWHKVNESHLGIYRCQNVVNNKTSCEVALRVYSDGFTKFLNLKDSEKDIILMVEGILLISCVVIPGTILLREKSKKSLQAKIQRYKEENENLYQGLNQADLSTYEDITRGQQCMYQDVANYRLSDSQLSSPEPRGRPSLSPSPIPRSHPAPQHCPPHSRGRRCWGE
uniref:B-cell antigen receptor complex-associated protein alpha chain n=1 Tax=Pristiophorus japonicus TaxID=55135 RepID=UPI00398E88C0